MFVLMRNCYESKILNIHKERLVTSEGWRRKTREQSNERFIYLHGKGIRAPFKKK